MFEVQVSQVPSSSWPTPRWRMVGPRSRSDLTRETAYNTSPHHKFKIELEQRECRCPSWGQPSHAFNVPRYELLWKPYLAMHYPVNHLFFWSLDMGHWWLGSTGACLDQPNDATWHALKGSSWIIFISEPSELIQIDLSVLIFTISIRSE